MKFKTSSLYCLLIIISFLIDKIDSHGVEVAHCLTPDGKLRIYVKSWHNDVLDPSQSGTMNIEDHQTGETSFIVPDGWIKNKPGTPSKNLPGCGSDVVQDSVCTSGYAKSSHWDDWAYFDYAGVCNIPVQYTLVQGSTVVLENGCDNIYPTVIRGTFSDSTPPTIKINEQVCEDRKVITVFEPPCENENSLMFVNFTISVVDDCDPNPIYTVDDPYDDNMYPNGETDIKITATDNAGKSSTCTLVISRTPKTCPCCDCIRRATIRPDPHYSCWDGTSYDFQGSCDQYAIKNRLFQLQVRSRGRNWYSTLTEASFKYYSTGEEFNIDTSGGTNGSPGQIVSTLGVNTYLVSQSKKWIIKFRDDPESEIRFTVYYDEISIEAVGTGKIFCGSEGMMGSWDYGGVRFPDGQPFDTRGGYSVTRDTSHVLALSWQVQQSDSLMNIHSNICTNDDSCGPPPSPVTCPKRTFRRTCDRECDNITDSLARSECEMDNEVLGAENNVYACNPATTDPLQCPDEDCDTDSSGFADAPPTCGDDSDSCSLLGADMLGYFRELICLFAQGICQFTCGVCCDDDASYSFTFEDELHNCFWLGNQDEVIKDQMCADSTVSDYCPKACDACFT